MEGVVTMTMTGPCKISSSSSKFFSICSKFPDVPLFRPKPSMEDDLRARRCSFTIKPAKECFVMEVFHWTFGNLPCYLSNIITYQFSSVQLLSHDWLFSIPWTAACQVSLYITNSWSSPKLLSIESVIPSSHLILCRPLLLLPTIPPSITVFSNESTLRMRWSKHRSLSFSISPSKEHPGLTSLEWIGWISLQSKGLSRVFSKTTVQKHQFFGAQISSQSNSHIHTWLLEKT